LRLCHTALGLVGALALCAHTVFADGTALSRSFAELCAREAGLAEQSGRMAVTGRDGWLFLAAELRYIGAGRFWGPDAVRVSRSDKPENADPLPAILDFDTQLRKLGIELIFVPVPPKAIIYPDMLSDSVTRDPEPGPTRLDAVYQEFHEQLRAHGVNVIDLVPIFLAARRSPAPDLYCRQDSHWSGAGIELAAREIAQLIRKRKWFKPRSDFPLTTEKRDVEISGDLRPALPDSSTARERVELKFIRSSSDSGPRLLQTDRESPVLLMGDSYTLVFHAGGDMHAAGAGLPEHLALNLKCPVDLIGVRGSGVTSSRISLFRKAMADNGYLAKKKVIVWCLGARDFTESSGWRKVPVTR